jgi:hypothetical protein
MEILFDRNAHLVERFFISSCSSGVGYIGHDVFQPTNGGNAYLSGLISDWSCVARLADLPGPEGDQESPPRKEKYAAVLIDYVEYWYGSGFVIYWIDLGSLI